MENVAKGRGKEKTIIKVAILFVLIIVVCLVYFIKTGKYLPDNKRFSREYTNVAEDNIYEYATKAEIEEAFDAESAVIFFGFPSCKWCQAYVETLNNLAKENGINKILYYNIKKDREKNSEFYNNIVSLTKEYLSLDEEGNPRIYVPDTYFVKNGEIIGHNNDIEQIDDLTRLIKLVAEDNCSDIEKGC